MSYPYDQPCDFEGCSKYSCGAVIDGRHVCIDHVDWAVGKSLGIVKPILEMLGAKPVEKQTFDLEKGKQLKEEGMALAADNRKSDLDIGRDIAKELARAGDGTCSADLVAKALFEQHKIETLGAAAGSLFRQKCWAFVRYRKSTKASSHARPISVWHLHGTER